MGHIILWAGVPNHIKRRKTTEQNCTSIHLAPFPSYRGNMTSMFLKLLPCVSTRIDCHQKLWIQTILPSFKVVLVNHFIIIMEKVTNEFPRGRLLLITWRLHHEKSHEMMTAKTISQTSIEEPEMRQCWLRPRSHVPSCVHMPIFSPPTFSVRTECSSLEDSNEETESLYFFFQLTTSTFLSTPLAIVPLLDQCTWTSGWALIVQTPRKRLFC